MTTFSSGSPLSAALAAHGAGRLDEAQAVYRALIEQDPAHVDALHYLGVALHQQGNHHGALELMDRALQHAPGDAICWSNRALAARALGQTHEAAHNLREALRLNPGFADAHNNLALTLRDMGDLEGAARHCRAALALDPAATSARINLGSVLAKLGRLNEAVACYREALDMAGDEAALHFNLANALKALGDDSAAIAHYRRAVELAPAFAAGWVNLGTALGQCGDYREAERCYREAVALEPNAANLVCLGASLGAQGRNDEEAPYYERALELDPDHADARQNLVWLKLKRGQYREGWAEYARRWRACDYAPLDIEGIREWTGEPLEGKRVLLVHEQGFGDQIQFVRYATGIAARGASVDVCITQPLQLLAQSVPGVHRAWTGKPAGDYDYWIYAMSAPSACGTELDTIPATVPYLFARDVEIEAWKRRVQAAVDKTVDKAVDKAVDSGVDNTVDKAVENAVDKIAGQTAARRKIGLVWGGSPTFYNNRNRSVPLAAFAPLFALDEISWFSLQKGDAARAQLAALDTQTVIHDFSDDLRDFGDTAALVMNLDLVIAVDTSVAHLAGALGKPVWVLVPANGEWRWLENRTDSPWYPTARLFRQQEVGEWSTAIEALRDALQAPAALSGQPRRASPRKSAVKPVVKAERSETAETAQKPPRKRKIPAQAAPLNPDRP
ncbi:tetratricopeptide repeat protein [Burkholderia sp. Ax-1719]|uniref:tetratricopeptide repeat protein n=1 Tax=Burkholderia sp. Ax-1719 TaxID=2608334 RepID=UPI001422A2D4|nr:tetratricopeptide repeat protein [Burkholderia sp. Ax-1719]NIE69190.1 tetratricopeptide repeat protein [Burkholderia sp. Ax-1719]